MKELLIYLDVILALLAVLVNLPATCDGQMVSITGHLTPDVFYSAPDTQPEKATSQLHCALLCVLKPYCLSATYRSASGYCGLNVGYLQEVDPRSDAQVSLEPSDTVYIALKERMEWHVVFAARQTLNSSLLDAWNDPSQADEYSSVSETSYGCLTVDSRLPCNRYFRSRYLNQWTPVSKMMVAMYTGGQRVAWIEFDGSGRTSWNDIYKMDRITDTSITELVGYSGQFVPQVSLEGYYKIRLFLLAKDFAGCGGDAGWFFISDIQPILGYYCPYEFPQPALHFRYTLTGYAANFNQTNMAYADTFAVFVKF